jgi:hypothetical protein
VQLVGQLVALNDAATGAAMPQQHRVAALAKLRVLGEALGGEHVAAGTVAVLVQRLPRDFLPPTGWYEEQQQPQHTVAAAAATLLRHLGWRLPGGRGAALGSISVARATALQLAPVVLERGERHTAFAALAVGGQAAPADVGQLTSLFPLLWRIKWSNFQKELYWRLVIDALPTSQRMHMAQQECACGAAGPGREHHFWDCPAAQAVVAELQRALPNGAISRAHVWLMRPVGGVTRGVWRVVCLAALRAMWVARGAMMVPQRRQRFVGGAQQLLQHAQRLAVQAFWATLEEFVCTGRHPAQWRRSLQHGAPFLHFPAPGARLRVHYV